MLKYVISQLWETLANIFDFGNVYEVLSNIHNYFIVILTYIWSFKYSFLVERCDILNTYEDLSGRTILYLIIIFSPSHL